MKKRTQIFLVICLLVFGGAYLGLWLYSADWLNREIDRVYAEGQENGVAFLGPKPRVTNFPFVPQVVYHGGIRAGNLEVLFPQVTVRGYPIPHTTLHINFPLGISLGGTFDPKIWSLDAFEAGLAIPYRFPAAFTEEDLRAWHEGGGKIDVRSYELRKNTLLADGKGLLALDDYLQPVFLLESNVRGYEIFIREKMDDGTIERLPAAFAMTMLNGLAKADEETGEQFVPITASVKSRILTVGPLPVLELPQIVWDTRNPPALHQQ